MNCCKIHYNQRRNEARWRLATGVEFILSTFGTGAHCLWCRCGLSRVQVSTLSCASEHSVGCRWTLHQMQVSTLSCASEHSVGCRWAIFWVQVTTLLDAGEHSIRCKWALCQNWILPLLPGQEASLASPCSNLMSFGSQCSVLKKVLVTLGLFRRLGNCTLFARSLCSWPHLDLGN